MRKIVGGIATCGLVLALIWPATQSVTAIDYQAACDTCNAQAWAEWQACWERYPDEGDAECRNNREIALSDCQQTYCIYINH